MFIAFLICIALFIMGIVVGRRFEKLLSDVGFGVVVVSLVCFVVFGVWCLVIYTEGVKDYGLLITREKVLQAGIVAIEATDKTALKEPYITDNKSIVGGIENMKQSSNTSERIKEYRDVGVEYEKLIGKYKAYCSIWWYRSAVPGCLVDYIEDLDKREVTK